MCFQTPGDVGIIVQPEKLPHPGGNFRISVAWVGKEPEMLVWLIL